MSRVPIRKIWLEPGLDHKRAQVVERCREALRARQGHRFIYLAATRALCDHVLDRLVDGRQITGARRPPVFLFDDLVQEILRQSPSAQHDRLLIEENIAHFLLERTIASLMGHGRLHYVPDIARQPGCVQTLQGLIGELKRANKSPEDFRRFLQAAGGAARDYDLAEIYQRYQEALDARGWMDGDDPYLLVRNGLAGAADPIAFPAVEFLFIDGFFDFTPIQDAILQHWIARIPEVMVAIPFDARHPAVWEPIHSTLQAFQQMGFTIEEPSAGAPSRHLLLERIPQQLFRPPPAPLSIDQPVPITIFSAPHLMEEVQEIGRQIKRLVADEGYQPEEIAVVARELEDYAPAIRRVFERDGVPCDWQERWALPAIPVVKAALKILEARGAWQDIRSFEILLKNDYMEPPASGERDAVAQTLITVGSHLSTDEWMDRARRLQAAQQKKIEHLRRRFAEADEVDWEILRLQRETGDLEAAMAAVIVMRRTLESLPERAALSEFCARYKKVILGFRLPQRLADRLYQAVRQTSDQCGVARDLRALKRLMDTLDLAAGIAADAQDSEESLSLNEFRTLVHGLAGRTWLETESMRASGVSVLDVRQCRGQSFRALFLAGMVQGVFPQTPSSGWMYSPSDRRRLAEQGLYLEDLSPNVLEQIENLFFYLTVCQATHQLFLSYPRTNLGEEESLPSVYLDDLRELYPAEGGQGIETRFLRPGGGVMKAPSTRADLLHGLIRGVWQGGPDEPLALELYRRAMIDGLLPSSLALRLRSETERLGPSFGCFDGKLGDVRLRNDLQWRFASEHVFSAGQLNSYGLCPFQFYSRWVLQLRPLSEPSLDLSSLDRARLVYDILCEFLGRHRGKKLLAGAAEEYQRELEEIAREIFNHYQNAAAPLDPLMWEMEKLDVGAAIGTSLEKEIEYQTQAEAHGVTPRWLNLGFGMTPSPWMDKGSTAEPLTLVRGAEVVKVRGRIDRVDQAGDGKLVAYQYRSSAPQGMEAMRQGYDMQIPLYILALRQLLAEDPEAVIGGGYFEWRAGTRNKGAYREEYSHYAGVRSGAESSLSPAEWEALLQTCEAQIGRYVEGMRRGDFRVQPKTTAYCARCDYRTVCRFDKHRIQQKVMSDE